MKNYLKLFSAAVLMMLTLTYTSCKKNDTDPDLTSKFAAASDDGTRVNNDMDEVSNDAASSAENNGAVSGRTDGSNGWLNAVCGVTATCDTANKILTLTYSGDNCNQTRSRTGTITVQLLPKTGHWGDKGAQLVINFNGLTITRLSDGKSITINGTKTITNVNGGLVVNLASNPSNSVTHTISSSNMTISFDNGTKRSWSISKQRVFTYNGGYFISETGTGTGGLAIDGTDRNGNEFTYTITPGQPLVVEETCFWQLISGQVVFGKLDRTLTVTAGLDALGDAISTCPGKGGFFYKATWTDAKGIARQYIGRY